MCPNSVGMVPLRERPEKVLSGVSTMTRRKIAERKERSK
jgi:hypothetical protein